jgi:hypothetical protein
MCQDGGDFPSRENNGWVAAADVVVPLIHPHL